MTSKLLESLLSEEPFEKNISVESCDGDDQEQDDDCQSTCNHMSYGDAVFSAFVVAPQVVSVWRGTWGIMELHSKLFPYAQTFLLGILLHVCFAVLRSNLLARSVEANTPKSYWRWLQERIISRIYTYVFILSNIMHWRGGWGLLDAAVAAIVPDEHDPHRPVTIAAFFVVFYIASVYCRSSRNILASPYFLVTDGKEPTYIFTTRFQTNQTQQTMVIYFIKWGCATLKSSQLKRSGF